MSDAAKLALKEAKATAASTPLAFRTGIEASLIGGRVVQGQNTPSNTVFGIPVGFVVVGLAALAGLVFVIRRARK